MGEEESEEIRGTRAISQGLTNVGVGLSLKAFLRAKGPTTYGAVARFSFFPNGSCRLEAERSKARVPNRATS